MGLTQQEDGSIINEQGDIVVPAKPSKKAQQEREAMQDAAPAGYTGAAAVATATAADAQAESAPAKSTRTR